MIERGKTIPVTENEDADASAAGADDSPDTATVPMPELREAGGPHGDRSRGFDPYNSGSFVLTRKPG